MRVSMSIVNEFLAQERLALVGASRGGRKFGNTLLRELRARGYEVLAVHPDADALEGQSCFRSLAALPLPVQGVVIVVPPRQTERVVREAAAAGIRRVWMQQGSESEDAIAFCREHGISVVHGECLLMFAEPAAFPHRAHRWIRGVFGRLPVAG